MTVFCLVSSKQTENYTRVCLNSFFKHTPMQKDDFFIFINNDGTKMFMNENYLIHNYINNEKPLSWAENFNQGLKIAKEKKDDFVLITNDVAFTRGWYEPICQKNDAIIIPCCNININYDTPNFKTRFVMKLEEYLNKEEQLDVFVKFQRGAYLFNELYERIFMQTYLARIPFAVHNEIGYFDETFSNCGGEDMDFRIRCAIKGFKTLIAFHSYVIHFHGKSSWDGFETNQEEKNRREKYLNKSREKWGNLITDIFVDGKNAKEKAYEIGLRDMFDKNESFNIINYLYNLRKNA